VTSFRPAIGSNVLCRHSSTADIQGTDPPAVTRTTVDESMDDLWADEDESLIYATLRDTVFPEPSVDSVSLKKIHTTVVKEDNIMTSTPKLRPRTSRLTFRIDPPSDGCVQMSTTRTKRLRSLLSPSTSLSKTESPGERSLNTEMSYTNLLATLVEPDEILDSLLPTKTDSAVSKSNQNNKSGMSFLLHIFNFIHDI